MCVGSEYTATGFSRSLLTACRHSTLTLHKRPRTVCGGTTPRFKCVSLACCMCSMRRRAAGTPAHERLALPQQALCELYDRPAHLYVYHPTKGATRLRTFHERTAAAAARPPCPMRCVGTGQCGAIEVQRWVHLVHRHAWHRLSYYGGGHYDSLVMRGAPAAVLTYEPRVLCANRTAGTAVLLHTHGTTSHVPFALSPQHQAR